MRTPAGSGVSKEQEEEEEEEEEEEGKASRAEWRRGGGLGSKEGASNQKGKYSMMGRKFDVSKE